MSGIVNDSMDKGSIMDTEDRTERIVDIYISAEAVRDMKHKKDTEEFNTAKPQTPQNTGSDGVKIRSSRAAGVCLVLLCVLLLTAVIVLCVLIYTKSTNYTQERDQLLIRNENLTNERELLILQNGNLTKERDQLKSEKNDLQKCLADGCKCNQSSLYFISSEMKSWTESRRYCRERAADLIIINNKEEQDFVKIITGSSEYFWIGLTDLEVEGRWKWVDGSNMTLPGFWGGTEPNGKQNEDCALNYSQGGADFPCGDTYKWICEKNILK
uniref:C-type lectin domain-containing protein n=4 Tax=Cyprinus carpio TaxID=7962 RepID=A0A8C1ATA7_CYPCA